MVQGDVFLEVNSRGVRQGGMKPSMDRSQASYLPNSQALLSADAQVGAFLLLWASGRGSELQPHCTSSCSAGHFAPTTV